MCKLVTIAGIALLLLVAPSMAQTTHYAKLGDLVVTATAVASQPAHDAGQHYVAVYARVRYAGTDTACASLSAELRDEIHLVSTEIARSSTDLHWPAPPRISHMARGDEATGAFVFEVKNGAEPLDLVVKLDSPSTACDIAVPALSDSPPAEIRLDLRDLPPPPDVKPAPIREFGVSGTGGYGMPACLYCPRAEYSPAAKKAKTQGVVVLVVVVTAEGKVTDIHVQKGLGNGLDAAAVAAVSTWRLKPALGPDGQPAAVRQIIEVTFQL